MKGLWFLSSMKVPQIGFIQERLTLGDSCQKISAQNHLRDIISAPSGGVNKSHFLINRIIIYGLIIRCTKCLLVSTKTHSTDFDARNSSQADNFFLMINGLCLSSVKIVFPSSEFTLLFSCLLCGSCLLS